MLCGVALVIHSCSTDDDGGFTPTSDDVTVQNFMWQAMNEWYFWQANVPDLADDRFANDQEYTEFLQATPNPEDFIRSILFTEDRFTFFNEDFEVLLNSLSGVSKSNGLQFFIIDLTEDDTNNVFGFVRNVVPGSTAAQAGLKRGDIFYGVDGQVLTPDNFGDLLFGENDTYTLNMGEADIANRLVIQTENEITLTKIEDFLEPPIREARTLDVNGQKIGYLLYQRFNKDFNEELNEVFGQFVANGVTDLVLDLRYNPGGSVNSSRLLASMIYGTNTNDLYIQQRWNDKQQARLSDVQLKDFFASVVSIPNPDNPDQTINVSLNSLNLDRVFVLATNRSASASELLINGLDPYIEVIHIGTTTTGKNEFSISLVDDPTGVNGPYTYGDGRRENRINPDNRWIIQPLVGRNENSVGFFDYTAGFAPDIELREDVFNLGELGDVNEPLLARALEEIKGVSSKQAQKSRFREPAAYRDFKTPVREFMILDKPLDLN